MAGKIVLARYDLVSGVWRHFGDVIPSASYQRERAYPVRNADGLTRQLWCRVTMPAPTHRTPIDIWKD